MVKRRDVFDAVLASVPLNKTAGAVTSRSGDHYEPKLKEYVGFMHWSAPPKLRPVPRNAPNVTGAQFGRMRVIGLWDDTDGDARKDQKAKWVVRCACGDYEVRGLKAIKNPKNEADCCRLCRDFQYKKRRYEQLGSKGIEEFTQ